MNLNGKVAIVTGAASGIGREVARTFNRNGAKVVIADLDRPAACSAAAEIGDHSSAIGVAMDVTNEEEVEAGMAATIASPWAGTERSSRGIAEETRSHWVGGGGHRLINPSNDPAITAIEQDVMKDVELQFAGEQASTARTELRRAIEDVSAVLSSPRLASIMNMRDKHLAHSLETTRREKDGPVQPIKYGDETELLNASIPIVERLYCWVNGTSFSIENSQEIDQNNAEALWTGCKFVDLR
jgi:hypothetical protein